MRAAAGHTMWSIEDRCLGQASPRRVIVWLMLVVVVGSCSDAFGQRPTAPRALDGAVVEDAVSDELFHLPLDDQLADRIDATIDRLDDPTYGEREKATAELIEIGASAFAKLRDAYRDSDTFELRLRIERIAYTGYFNFHVYDGNGFLGVSMQPYPSVRQPVKGIPKDTVGVVVVNIIKGTGAERAGVKKHDVIVAVDGRPLHGVGNDLLNNLSKRIRTKRPGYGLKLDVLRGSKPITIDVTLGRCPPKQAKGNTVRGTSELYRKAARRFPVWWATYFENDLAAGAVGA